MDYSILNRVTHHYVTKLLQQIFKSLFEKQTIPIKVKNGGHRQNGKAISKEFIKTYFMCGICVFKRTIICNVTRLIALEILAAVSEGINSAKKHLKLIALQL